MTLFYLLLLAVAALPVAMVSPSLFGRSRRQASNTPLTDQELGRQMNVEITRERIEEVGQYLESPQERVIAEQELQATLLDDLHNSDNRGKTIRTVPAAWNVALLLLIPVTSLVIYSWIGNPQFADTSAPLMAGNPNSTASLDLDTLLGELEKKIAGDPKNPQGWELAATTYMRIGNYAKAENAYAELNRLVVGDPDLLTAWADALIMRHGGYIPAARAQVEKALSIDPFHVNALWVAGLGAHNLGNHAAATDYFNRLKPLLADNPESVNRVNELIRRSAAASANEDRASPATGQDTTSPPSG